jgi:hypothetical protein
VLTGCAPRSAPRAKTKTKQRTTTWQSGFLSPHGARSARQWRRYVPLLPMMLARRAVAARPFWEGLLLTTGLSSAARPPPKKTRACASSRPRPSAESAPLSQPLYCMSTRPTSPPYPAPQLLSPPSPPPSPDPLVSDLQLASVGASAARRDSASSRHPGRAYFSLPRRTCVCARHATPQPPSAAACGTSAPRLPPRGFR